MRWLKNLMGRLGIASSTRHPQAQEGDVSTEIRSRERRGPRTSRWDDLEALMDLNSELLRAARGSSSSDTKRVRELMSLGATVSCQDSDEETPLMKAAWAGNVETMKFLVTSGADLEARNWEGKTPLMASAIYGHLPALEYLLDLGASPFVRCDRGETARSYASLTGNHRIKDRLMAVETHDLQLIDPPLVDAKCSNCGGDFFHYAEDGAPVHFADGRSAVGQVYLCVRCGRKARFRDELL